jgi:hypothetical protein
MPAVNSAALGPFFAIAGALLTRGVGVGWGGGPDSLWQALAAVKMQSIRTLAVFIRL